jgi:hypothetical protein
VTIPDFNTLVAKSQSYQTPVFELDEDQIGLTGPILATTLESRDRFRVLFSDLADEIIALTTDASGN